MSTPTWTPPPGSDGLPAPDPVHHTPRPTFADVPEPTTSEVVVTLRVTVRPECWDSEEQVTAYVLERVATSARCMMFGDIAEVTVENCYTTAVTSAATPSHAQCQDWSSA